MITVIALIVSLLLAAAISPVVIATYKKYKWLDEDR
ncbi:MAG: hypothetical protein QG639_142, partial [Patescibacteria group bacterium]|nr:hypothetical protein [Patescibacteria group bacterium]